MKTDESATRFYNDDNVLVGLVGVNISGDYGMFFDELNGLCEHERTPKYCETCNAGDSHGE